MKLKLTYTMDKMKVKLTYTMDKDPNCPHPPGSHLCKKAILNSLLATCQLEKRCSN